MTTETISNLKNTRRTDLDWLRVLAVLLLVPFHSALIFIADPHVVMYVKDGVSSSLLNRFAGWIHQFHMPLLFYVSGAATYFSLKKRKSGQYIKERFLKLLIPAISGLLLVIPPITYIAQIAKGNSLTYWQHFTNFWQLRNADLTGMDGKFTPAHLWFSFISLCFFFGGVTVFLPAEKSQEYRIISTNN